jgi:hypothetical protein
VLELYETSNVPQETPQSFVVLGLVHSDASQLVAKHLEIVSVPHTIVARAWKRAGLQPHRLERYLRSTDPISKRRRRRSLGSTW